MPGIYIHIPFCKQACNYCNFHFSTSRQLKNDFVAALLKEIHIQREYLAGGKTHDLHEGNLTHLENAERVYLQMAEWFPEDFTIIECVENGSLLSIDQIHEKVWVAARKVLEA